MKKKNTLLHNNNVPFFAALVLGVTIAVVFQVNQPKQIINDKGLLPTEPVVCPMDMFTCPDGSMVGRTAPLCEFAACPLDTNLEYDEDSSIGVAPEVYGTFDQ